MKSSVAANASSIVPFSRFASMNSRPSGPRRAALARRPSIASRTALIGCSSHSPSARSVAAHVRTRRKHAIGIVAALRVGQRGPDCTVVLLPLETRYPDRAEWIERPTDLAVALEQCRLPASIRATTFGSVVGVRNIAT